MDKVDWEGGNKTQRLHRCGSNYALSKIIMNNGLDDHYHISSGTRSWIERIYIDIKIANNTGNGILY